MIDEPIPIVFDGTFDFVKVNVGHGDGRINSAYTDIWKVVQVGFCEFELFGISRKSTNQKSFKMELLMKMDTNIPKFFDQF